MKASVCYSFLTTKFAMKTFKCAKFSTCMHFQVGHSVFFYNISLPTFHLSLVVIFSFVLLRTPHTILKSKTHYQLILLHNYHEHFHLYCWELHTLSWKAKSTVSWFCFIIIMNCHLGCLKNIHFLKLEHMILQISLVFNSSNNDIVYAPTAVKRKLIAFIMFHGFIIYFSILYKTNIYIENIYDDYYT